MATIKMKFRSSEVPGKRGTVYYQIRHKGKVRQITANVHLTPAEWEVFRGHSVLVSEVPEPLRPFRFQVNADLLMLKRVVNELNGLDSPYTSADVVRLFRQPEKRMSVLNYFDELISALTANRKLGTAGNYRRSANSLRAFLAGRDISFAMLDEDLVTSYDNWLYARGVTRNTASFYMRALRAVFNKAVKRQLAKQTYPFENVYTGVDKTCKRAVDENAILNLSRLDLRHAPSLDLARDLFLFSYCTRGMAFVDIAYLRKREIADGVIVYCRRKTGQTLMVRIEPCAQRILNKYEEATRMSAFVFPLLSSEDTDVAYGQYQTALSVYNRRLKRLARMVGVPVPLTSYVARHTWATAARDHQVPLSVISAGMGHTSEKTTQIYLAALENSVVDRANRGLLAELNTKASLWHLSVLEYEG